MPLAVKINIQALLERWRKSVLPQEIVAVDFSSAEIKCGRLRRANSGVHLLAADILPPVAGLAGADKLREAREQAINWPKDLLCRHAVLCVPGQHALIKLLNIPGRPDTSSEAKIKEDMGIGAGDYRIGYKVLGYSHGRVETKLLTVAVLENSIQRYLACFASGWPVPVAVELAGLAAINAFLNGYLESSPDESLGVVQCEDEVSFFAFIHKKELVLIRKYDFGYNHLLSAIQARLNVNRETALNVAADHSFDISQMVREVCDPFVRQLVISKHFVERRENCRVTRIFIPGEALALHRLGPEIRVAAELEVEPWDPLKAIICQLETAAPRLAQQPSRLAVLAGAGLGFLEGAGAPPAALPMQKS